MKRFEVRIPRLVRMTEWEIMIVEADDKDQALQSALERDGNVSDYRHEQEDFETMDEYLDDVEIMELKEAV